MDVTKPVVDPKTLTNISILPAFDTSITKFICSRRSCSGHQRYAVHYLHLSLVMSQATAIIAVNVVHPNPASWSTIAKKYSHFRRRYFGAACQKSNGRHTKLLSLALVAIYLESEIGFLLRSRLIVPALAG